VAPTPLTKREDEIRRLVVDGLTNDAIASALGISSRTVEAHLRMLFRKTGASRRDELGAPPRPDGDAPAGPASPALERRVAELERSLSERDLQVRSYDAAVKRLADRQFPLFDERVEITLVVGNRSAEDRVVERHWTTPNPYVVYRVIRPITPLKTSYAAYAETLGLTFDVQNADVEVSADLVADSSDRPLVLVTFQPGLQQATEWELRYRTPGMWDPLRRTGTDTLGWSAGTLDGRHAVGLEHLLLRVEFPPGVSGGLEESRGIGGMERASSGDSEVLVFRDDSRTGGYFRWTLRMDVTGAAGEARLVERD
jgi:DNA-binding CsgD family transcriptional regulator